MNLAMEDIIYREGKNRKEVEEALDHIYNQLKLIDEKLKARTDMEVWNNFQQEQDKVKQFEKNISALLK